MVRAANEARVNNMLLLGVTVLTSSTEETLREIGIQNRVDDQVLRLAKLGIEAGIDGVVASSHEIKPLRREFGDKIKIVVPGIRPSWSEPGDQKRTMTPCEALEAGADYLVIGRPIIAHRNPKEATKRILERYRGLSNNRMSGRRCDLRVYDLRQPERIARQFIRMTLFAVLDVYRDVAAHSAAMNMAIDEALLEHVTIPLIRFYRWQSPALSFGYFGRFADVASYQAERDLVRRWTGGGIVFHGKDLTYSIVIPANDAAFAESSVWIYERIHRALCEALVANGLNAVVAGIGDPDPWSATARTVRTALSDAGHRCFVKPVRADVVINGGKVAGAAQRRTRCGLLQQGSIQEIDLGDGLTEQFAAGLMRELLRAKRR